MLVLFVIVAAAVLTVTWSRWEHIPIGISRFCGMLSIALGVRTVALITALLLVPLFPSRVRSDESPAAEEAKSEQVADVVNESEAEPKDVEQPAAATPEEKTASDDKVESAVEPIPADRISADRIPADSDASPKADESAKPQSEAAPERTEPASPAEPAPTAEPTKPAPTAEPAPSQSESASPVVEKSVEPKAVQQAVEVEIPAEKNEVVAEKPDSNSLSAPEPVVEKPLAPQAEALEPAATPEAVPTSEDQIASRAFSQEPVKFVTDVKYFTPNRPSWLELPPTYEKNGDELRVAVKAGPYRTVRDCEPDLEREVSVAVADYVNQNLKSPYASTFVTYSLDDLRRKNVVREQFSEQLGTSIGLMNQVHAQLVFDNQFRDEIEHRWSEITAKSRLAQTGLGAGIVLLLLSTLFSYFKVDTATKGYYTGRLQFATAGAILALVAASVLLAKFIPWM